MFNREGRDNKGAVKAGPAVIKQVFGLQKLHELSGPFELENGSWAIAQLTRIEASETSALKDVRLTIQDNLLRDKRIEERTAYIDGLLSRTKVIIHDEVLKEMKIDVAEEKGWDPSSPKPPPVKTIQLPPNAFSGKGSLLRPGGLEKQVPLKADPIVRMKAEEIQEQMRRDP